MQYLLQLLLLVQAQTAEETFKKIEEKIVSAKTLGVKFTLTSSKEAAQDDKKSPLMSGTLLLKEGNKGLLTHQTSQFPIASIRLSDGRKIRAGGLKFEHDSPDNFKEGTLLGLARVGLMPTIFLSFQMLDIGEEDKAFQRFVKNLRVEKVRFGEDPGVEKTLIYSVAIAEPYHPGKIESAEAQIWYDPKTFNILKRTLKSGREVLIETFQDWAFNSDIPDEKFKLPAEK